MTRNKHFRSVLAALLCAVLCMTAFATVAYADGGDYYDDELPPETWQEDTQPEDTTIVPGTPFTEDGIAATRDLPPELRSRVAGALQVSDELVLLDPSLQIPQTGVSLMP